jgi:ABC-type polysaccharide/polyol phosphate export permease
MDELRDPLLFGGRRLPILLALARNEFHARYRAQALGVLWSVFSPLVQMGLISAVVGRLLHVPNLPVFMLIGIVVWQWVTSGLNSATRSFVDQGELVRRTAFPRALLPVAVLLGYAVNLGLDLLVLTALSAVWPGAFRLSPALLCVPLLLALLLAALSGAALAAAALNVLYRDVAYAVTTALSLLYWATPIVYPLEVIPEPYRALVRLNPLAGIVTALRGAIMHGAFPAASEWLAMAAASALALGLGFLVYRRCEPALLDHV